eukprot:4960877-Amphidinium_carterae.1
MVRARANKHIQPLRTRMNSCTKSVGRNIIAIQTQEEEPMTPPLTTRAHDQSCHPPVLVNHHQDYSTQSERRRQRNMAKTQIMEVGEPESKVKARESEHPKWQMDHRS